jgi:hypothetical protein
VDSSPEHELSGGDTEADQLPSVATELVEVILERPELVERQDTVTYSQRTPEP